MKSKPKRVLHKQDVQLDNKPTVTSNVVAITYSIQI